MQPTSPIKRLNRLLTSENLWLYLLSLIKRGGTLYAYGLDKQIESEFSFKPSKVMIYIVLYRLESEGLIRSEFQDRRKYYSLTEKGEEALNQAREHFKMLVQKI